jgi:hypothetical protein
MPVLTVDEEGAEEIEFVVYCERCGAGLCRNTTVAPRRFSRIREAQRVDIEPCAACLGKARTEGYDEGFDAGVDKARSEPD